MKMKTSLLSGAGTGVMLALAMGATAAHAQDTTVAWKGAPEPAEVAAGVAAAELVGLAPAGVHAVTPFPAAERRTLHVFRKVAPTPPRFPRRAGMAVKRPLG